MSLLSEDATGNEDSSFLGWRMISGACWVGAATVFAQGLQVVQLIVLSRFLSPADFGVMAMASVVVGLAALPCEAGIGMPFIQRKDFSIERFSSLYWLGLLVGLGLFALVVGSAPAVAWAFHEPRLLTVLGWAALPVLIAPLGQPYQWMMERNLEFRMLGRIEIAAATAGLGMAIGAAVWGLGIFCLVVSTVGSITIRTFLLLVLGFGRWKPRWRLQSKDYCDLLGFGLNHLGQRITNFVSGNVDDLLIGRFMGAELLGFYSFAMNLAYLLSTRINGVLGRVSLPLMARLQDDVSLLRRTYLRLHEFSSTLNFPIQIGLAVTAPLIVPLFFGARWLPSVPLLQILALAGLARASGGTVGSLLLARGRAKLGFLWSLLVLILQTSGITAGVVMGSIQAVAWVTAGLLGLYAVLTYVLLVRALVRPCLGPYLGSMLPSLMISLAMGAGVWGVSVADRTLPPAARVVLEVIAGVVIYGGLMIIVRPDFIKDLRRLLVRAPVPGRPA